MYLTQFYLEFNPRDFEQHVSAEIKADKKLNLTTAFEKVIKERAECIAKDWIGDGFFGETKIDRKSADAELYFFKGQYYFESLDFTEEQKEIHKKAYGHLIGKDSIPLYVEVDAGSIPKRSKK